MTSSIFQDNCLQMEKEVKLGSVLIFHNVRVSVTQVGNQTKVRQNALLTILNSFQTGSTRHERERKHSLHRSRVQHQRPPGLEGFGGISIHHSHRWQRGLGGFQPYLGFRRVHPCFQSYFTIRPLNMILQEMPEDTLHYLPMLSSTSDFDENAAMSIQDLLTQLSTQLFLIITKKFSILSGASQCRGDENRRPLLAS